MAKASAPASPRAGRRNPDLAARPSPADRVARCAARWAAAARRLEQAVRASTKLVRALVGLMVATAAFAALVWTFVEKAFQEVAR